MIVLVLGLIICPSLSWATLSFSPNVNKTHEFWADIVREDHNRYHLGDERFDSFCTSLDGPVCNAAEKSKILAVKRESLHKWQVGVPKMITDEVFEAMILENLEDQRITFVNKLKKSVDVFHVVDSTEKFVRTLPSGELVALHSLENHYWRVKIHQNPKVVYTTIAGTSSIADVLPVKSYDGKHPTQITFFNRASEEVEVLWVNYEGMGEKYGSLRHGFEQLFTTFVSHPWCVRTKKKKEIILIIWPTPTPRRIIVPELPVLASARK